MKIILKDKKIEIRDFSRKDLKRPKDFQMFINSFVEEDAMLSVNKKKSLKDEKKFLSDTLKAVRGRKKVLLIAEHNGRIIGDANVELMKNRFNHIAAFGIAIVQGYRGIGLGKALIKEIVKSAKSRLKPRPKFIRLSVFKNNIPAIALYKKMGFKITAEIPKQLQYKGKLINEIVMLLELK